LSYNSAGKPQRMHKDETDDPNFLVKKFRKTCSWMSFTFNRDDTNWKYEVLICKSPPCAVTFSLWGWGCVRHWPG